jgi:hypothetical protein
MTSAHDKIVGEQCHWLHCSIVILIPGMLSAWRSARWATCCLDILISILTFFTVSDFPCFAGTYCRISSTLAAKFFRWCRAVAECLRSLGNSDKGRATVAVKRAATGRCAAADP